MDQDFTLRWTAQASPEAVFSAVCRPQDWWSKEIVGPTEGQGAEFDYHYQDVHRCSFRITEFEQGRKVVWHVLTNHFNFTSDTREWVGTDVVFELTPVNGGTELTFTHRGLVKSYECYEVCRDAWTAYIGKSLKDLVLTGQGQPNPLEDVVARAKALAGDIEYKVTFPLPPAQVMAAVERPELWWSQDIRGSAQAPGEEFVFQYQDLHRTVHRVTERIPGRRAVWKVTESRLSFVDDPQEWKDTELIFEAFPREGGTELVFVHAGLNPTKQCFDDCSGAWKFYITQSLAALVTTGQGKPEAVANPVEKS